MSPPETQLDRVLVALGHSTRRAMLLRLQKKTASAVDLQELSDVAYQTTWKHIRMLERAGLITRDTSAGKVQPITLETAPLDALRDWLQRLYPEQVQPVTVLAVPNADDRIHALIQTFVNDLSDLVTRSTVEAVREALQRGAATGASARGSGGAARALARSRAPAAKRTPEELERTTAALLAYVSKNPGQRIEEIATGMGTTTRELALPAKKLIAARAVKTKGQKRATRYYAR